jgi:hypothetical protein
MPLAEPPVAPRYGALPLAAARLALDAMRKTANLRDPKFSKMTGLLT